jgi:hypothetical protein
MNAALGQFEAYLFPHNPTFDNPPFDLAPYRVLIVRLSPLRDVDRSTPHLFLFQEVRRALPGAFVDMAFMPDARQREMLAREGIAYLTGIQSRRGADQFDLILISNAYTLELINLPYLLIRSGIPLYASQRDTRWPIFILGGSNALAAQAVIGQDGDSLVDGLFVGEGEGRVAQLATLLAAGQREDKARLLQQAASQVEGLWAAGTSEETTKAICAADEQAQMLVQYPLLNSPEVDTANLQISYGCPAFCSFCFEGYDRKPYREIPLPRLLDAAREIKRRTGAATIDLYSFNFNTHSEILPLLLELHKLFHRVRVQSQRADILQQTGYLLEAEVLADKRHFTLGIEGISQKQRAWLHKSLETNEILRLLERLFQQPIREIKLFYILTGHEGEEDMLEFHDFVLQVKALRQAHNPGIRVIFSFGLLIRMPFTPLRYDQLYLDEAHWRLPIGRAKSSCETNGFEFRMAYDWQTYCVSQVMALGGYWLTAPIVELAQEGYCFDSTLAEGYWERLRERLDASGHWTDAFLGEKGRDYAFPLSFVRSRIGDDFLYEQYQEAQHGLDRGYCLGRHDAQGRCLGCGACLDDAQRQAITHHQAHLPPRSAYMAALREVIERKRHLEPLYYVLRLDELPTGVWPALLNALALRRMLDRYPQLIDNLIDVQERLFSVTPPSKGRRGIKRGRFPTMSGESVFALYAWEADALQAALSASTAEARPFDVVRPASGFRPGMFEQVHLELYLPAVQFEHPRQLLERYLEEAYVPYSLRRQETRTKGARRYRFDVPEKGLKKKVVFGGHFEQGPEGLRAELEIGHRFDLLTLLEPASVELIPYVQAHISQIRW